MKPSLMTDTLTALIPTGQPLWIWGPPGGAKSTIVRKVVTEKLGLELRDIRAVTLDPVDLRGLPSILDGRTRWNVPDFLPTSGAGVIFLDELAQAMPAVQAALLQLCLEGRLGDYILPADWRIVAASNRAEDRAGGHRIISPLLNRFVHLDMEVDLDDWLAWARSAGIPQQVISFISFKPTLLSAFQPDANERGFPTPRSWEFVGRMMTHLKDENRQDVVGGAVGKGAATELESFLETWGKLPDIDKEIIPRPETATVPNEPSVVFALCGALAARAKSADTPKLRAILKYLLRFDKEFAVLGFRDTAANNKAWATTTEGKQFITTYGDMIRGTN